MMRIIYRIIGIVGVLLGVLIFAHAVVMWLGGVIVLPLGFLFGIGEASSYTTMRESLINLFWHIVPGYAGLGISLLSVLVTILLFWGSLSAWYRADKLSQG